MAPIPPKSRAAEKEDPLEFLAHLPPLPGQTLPAESKKWTAPPTPPLPAATPRRSKQPDRTHDVFLIPPPPPRTPARLPDHLSDASNHESKRVESDSDTAPLALPIEAVSSSKPLFACGDRIIPAEGNEVEVPKSNDEMNASEEEKEKEEKEVEERCCCLAICCGCRQWVWILIVVLTCLAIGALVGSLLWYFLFRSTEAFSNTTALVMVRTTSQRRLLDSVSEEGLEDFDFSSLTSTDGERFLEGPESEVADKAASAQVKMYLLCFGPCISETEARASSVTAQRKRLRRPSDGNLLAPTSTAIKAFLEASGVEVHEITVQHSESAGASVARAGSAQRRRIEAYDAVRSHCSTSLPDAACTEKIPTESALKRRMAAAGSAWMSVAVNTSEDSQSGLWSLLDLTGEEQLLPGGGQNYNRLTALARDVFVQACLLLEAIYLTEIRQGSQERLFKFSESNDASGEIAQTTTTTTTTATMTTTTALSCAADGNGVTWVWAQGAGNDCTTACGNIGLSCDGVARHSTWGGSGNAIMTAAYTNANTNTACSTPAGLSGVCGVTSGASNGGIFPFFRTVTSSCSLACCSTTPNAAVCSSDIQDIGTIFGQPASHYYVLCACS